MKLKEFKTKLLEDTYYITRDVDNAPMFYDVEGKRSYSNEQIKETICSFFEEYDIQDNEDVESDDIIEKWAEYADNRVNPYHWNRMQWLASDLHNAESFEEVVQEYGIDSKNFDFFSTLGMAMSRINESVLSIIINDLK
jgi:hypothetical protein